MPWPKGRPWPPEKRAQMSALMSGDNNPAKRPEVRAKLSATQKGRPLSPERRARLADEGRKAAAALRGKTLPPEHCAAISKGKTRHGHALHGAETPEYRTWTNMNTRCSNPNAISYPRYGGRGIEVRFNSFEEFLAEVGPKPGPEYSIDRIDNDGHYEPGNVRWATASEQARNRRRAAA